VVHIRFFATYSPFGFNSQTACSISLNGQYIARQGQTDGGPTIIYHLVKLAENDIISASVEIGPSSMIVNIPGGIHHGIQLNILLIK